VHKDIARSFSTKNWRVPDGRESGRETEQGWSQPEEARKVIGRGTREERQIDKEKNLKKKFLEANIRGLEL